MKTVIQSILFDKKIWTVARAVAWLHNNTYKVKKVDETLNFYRFRQRTPRADGHYYTVVGPKAGIEIVIMQTV